MKRIYKLFAIVFVSLLLSSCEKSKNFSETEEKQEITTQSEIEKETKTASIRENILRLSCNIPKTFNPILNSDPTINDVLQLIYEPLVIFDENLKPIFNQILVSDFEITDPFSMTIILNEKAIWDDETKITTADLAYTIDSLKSAGENAFYKESGQNVSYEIVTTHIIRLNFVKNINQSMYLLDFPIISKHQNNEMIDLDKIDELKIIGNGPYSFAKYNARKNIELTKNNNFLGNTAKIDNISVGIIQDARNYYTLEQNIVDLYIARKNETSAHLPDFSSYNIKMLHSTYFDFVNFNFKNDSLKDVNIRKVISNVVDYENLVKSMYKGRGEYSSTGINPNSWTYIHDEKVVNSMSISEYERKLILDCENMLEKNGWIADENNKRKYFANSTKTLDLDLRILVNEENESRKSIARYLQTNLQKAGFTITLEVFPYFEYEQKIANGDFDIYIGGVKLPMDNSLQNLLTNNIKTYTDANIADETETIDNEEETEETGETEENTVNREVGSLSNSKLNTNNLNLLFKKINNSNSEMEFNDNLQELQKYITTQIPVISLAFLQESVIIQKSIAGELTPGFRRVYNGIENLYFK